MILLLALAAGPHGLSVATPEQLALHRRGREMLLEGDRLARAGKTAETVPLAVKALEIDRQVFGVIRASQMHLCDSVGLWLAHGGRAAEAVPLRRDLLAARRLYHPPGDWRAIDAYHALRVAERLRDSPEAWRKYDEALNLGKAVAEAQKKARFAEALTLVRRQEALTREAFGEWHPVTAIYLHNLGLALQDLGRRQEALPVFERAVRIQARVCGEAHPAYAASLNALGETLAALGDLRTGLRLAERAFEISLAAHGPDHRDVCTSLCTLSYLYRETGNFKTARLTAEKALELGEGLLGTSHVELARALDALSLAQRMLADLEASLASARRALALRVRGLGASHTLTAQSRETVAVALSALGRDAESRRELQEVVAIYKRVGMEKSIPMARALVYLSRVLWRLGDPRASLDAATRAAGMTRAAAGERHFFYPVAVGAVAEAQVGVGDLPGALATLRRVLALLKASRGEDSPAVITCLGDIAAVLAARGEVAEALPLLKRASDLARAAFGERHPKYASALRSLALAQLEDGDEGAGALLVRVYEIRLATFGASHPDTIQSMLDRVALATRRNDRDGEFEWQLKAMRAVRAGGLAATPLYSRVLAQLGTTYHEAGMLKEALPILKEAVARARSENGEKHPRYVMALGRLARLQADMGSPREAAVDARRVAGLVDAYEGELSREGVMSRNDLAAILQQVGDLGAAAEQSELAVGRASRRLALAAGSQSEQQQLNAAASLRNVLNLRLSLPGAGYGHVLDWKGAVFGRQQAMRRTARLLSKDGSPEAMELLGRVDVAVRGMAAVALGGVPGGKARLDELARERDEAEEALSARAAFREARRPVSPEAVVAALPDGVALVDFLGYVRHDHTRRGAGRYTAHVAAWVLRRGAAPARVELGPAAPIEAAAARWRESLARGEDGARDGAALRRLIWLPLEPLLGGAGTVLSSPDGALAWVPLAALPGARSGAYLIEERAFGVVPVPRLLPESAGDARAGLLLAGGLEFGKGWSALPATAPEAEAVRKAFTARHPKARVQELRGAGADGAALRRGLPLAGVAHLATHAYFKEAGGHPGLMSGVVLSGGGVLTALEVAEMDLSGMDLAVLSACETGLGKSAAAEGLLGLQRAFAVAGCRSVVSSLWSVHDAATAVLMERFYHHLWEKRLPKIEALRQAQLDVMRHPDWVEAKVKKLTLTGLRGVGKAGERVVAGKGERRSPAAWWAAWQLSGDWR